MGLSEHDFFRGSSRLAGLLEASLEGRARSGSPQADAPPRAEEPNALIPPPWTIPRSSVAGTSALG